MSQSVLFERNGPVVWITLNRPAALNALTVGLLQALGDALDKASSDKTVRTIAITGAGRAFCAGADIRELAACDDIPHSILTLVSTCREVFERIEHLEIPVIAALNGLTMAGGLELALRCDIVVAARGISIGDAHSNYGLLPGGGATVYLPVAIGALRAKQLLLTGKSFSSEEMQCAGLVTQVVPAERLRSTVEEIGRDFSHKSRAGIATVKALTNATIHPLLAAGVEREYLAYQEHALHPDVAEGIAAFREGRRPLFGEDNQPRS